MPAFKRHGLARVLSKLGFCSRTQAVALIEAGRVSVDDRVQRNPERPTDAARERIAVDGVEVREAARVYLALNKTALEHMHRGVVDAGEHLNARRARMLRSGEKNAWLEIVLDEGRNRHIRRLLKALGFEVLRLVRVAIGPIELGVLPKGQWRALTAAESRALADPSSTG